MTSRQLNVEAYNKEILSIAERIKGREKKFSPRFCCHCLKEIENRWIYEVCFVRILISKTSTEEFLDINLASHATTFARLSLKKTSLFHRFSIVSHDKNSFFSLYPHEVKDPCLTAQ
jgi:hypothetical protein